MGDFGFLSLIDVMLLCRVVLASAWMVTALASCGRFTANKFRRSSTAGVSCRGIVDTA